MDSKCDSILLHGMAGTLATYQSLDWIYFIRYVFFTALVTKVGFAKDLFKFGMETNCRFEGVT